MSKAPQTRPAQRAGGLKLFSRKREASENLPMVAVPLTEQEALAELAAMREAEDRRRREQIAERAAREAREEREAAPPVDVSAPEPECAAGTPWFAYSSGRVSLSLGGAGMFAVAGAMCGLVIVGYSFGRRPGAAQGPLSKVAAVTNKSPASESVHEKAAPAQTSPAPVSGDLAELLKQPSIRPPAGAVKANQPARTAAGPVAGAIQPEDMNYLQIESFLITRERSGDEVAQDLAAARRFLAERGVRTFARRRSNAFLLYAEQGFPPSRESAGERDRFRRRIEQLGQEFRTVGGRYQFKGCLFVSYAHTKTGDPA